MSKRRVERERHDERVAGRNVTINRRIREESAELDCCEECHSPVRVDGMRRCNSCGTLACVKCVTGGHCKFCHEIYGMDPIDMDDDDLGDSREDHADPTCEEGDDVDDGALRPRPTNWDRFSDDMN